ncbi:trigger factor [Phaeocystidibacter marisrubri]|uniref:Trigger factor n=2 Tax=Phaeocystidibacter marisrubri TaxID=1577780 RepID=A0A6L3ZEN5_9FLAO|nr:trigger factor [Phaeocystidibacter marisrubri]
MSTISLHIVDILKVIMVRYFASYFLPLRTFLGGKIIENQIAKRNKMNISKRQIDDLNVVVTIQVTPEDYADKVKEILEDYRRNAKIPGFRPGKVPAGMVKRQYGKAVTIDEVNKLLQNSIFEYIQEEKLDILGNPLPVQKEDIDWDSTEPIDFEFELGLTPSFELPINKKTKVAYHTIKLDSKAIDNEVEGVARRYGKMSEPESTELEDILYGILEQVDADGNTVEGGFNKEARFAVKELKTKKKQGEAMKMAKGDVIDINPSKDFVADFNVTGALGVSADDLKNMEGVKFTLSNVYRIEPAELNQELFDKVFGEGVVTSEEEFRAKLEEEMGKAYGQETDNFFLNTVSDMLMDKVEFDLPVAFLKKWMRTAGETPITEEEVEAQWDNTAKGLKWQLIENKLVKDNHLHVHKEELEDYAAGYVRQQMAQFGQANLDDEQVKNIAQSVIQDQEQAQGMSDRILNDKMIAFFKENLKLDEKAVSYDEFVKLVNEQK